VFSLKTEGKTPKIYKFQTGKSSKNNKISLKSIKNAGKIAVFIKK
jgi:hypothetical protein